MSGVAGKALKAGAVGVAAGFGAALVKGFGRLKAIDDARFKLEGLGHDAAAVETIMESAMGAVKGTAFGFGEAATIAASAVAAGIEPGKELERILSITGDAASIAGISIGEMGSIFNKVAAGNRASMQEVNQLADRGIPIMQWLADEYGVTALEARDMVEKGQVDFATFANVIETNIGGAALKAGESFGGAFANMGAALGRFGAAILGPAFAAAPQIFGNLTDGIDAATASIGPLVGWFQRFQTPITVVSGLIASLFIPHLISLAATATVSAAKQVAAWVATQAGAVKAAVVHSAQVVKMVAGWVTMGAKALVHAAKVVAGWAMTGVAALKNIAIHVAQAAVMVAKWVWMGVQSLLHAAKVAAAWFIALGPVGWVIAGVIGLVALIIANWDKVVSFTKAMAEKVASWFRSARDWVVGIATTIRDKVVEFFTGLRDGVVEKVEAVVDRVKQVKDDVVGFFSGAATWLLNAGKNIVQGIIDGITSKIQAVKDAAGRVTSAVKRFLPGSPVQEGPLKVLNRGRAGKQIVEMLAGGIDAKLGMLQSMSDRMASAAAPDIPTVRVPAAVRAGRVVGGDGATVGTDGPRTLVVKDGSAGSSGLPRMLVRAIRDDLIRLEMEQ